MGRGSGIGTDETIAGTSSGDATLASQRDAGSAGAGASSLPEISRDAYAIKGELARGGMGKILVAEDTRRTDLAEAVLAGTRATDAQERMRLELARTRIAAAAADPVAMTDHLVAAIEAAGPSLADVPPDARTPLPADCIGDSTSFAADPAERLDMPANLAAAIEREAMQRASESYLAMLVGDYRYATAVRRIYTAFGATFHADVESCRSQIEADLRDDRCRGQRAVGDDAAETDAAR